MGVIAPLQTPLGIFSQLWVSSGVAARPDPAPLGFLPFLSPPCKFPTCLEPLTFLVLGELPLQSLQLCVELALLGLCFSKTLSQLLGLIPQIILGKKRCD